MISVSKRYTYQGGERDTSVAELIAIGFSAGSFLLRL